jgi:blocked-early-in-transport protein 1
LSPFPSSNNSSNTIDHIANHFALLSRTTSRFGTSSLHQRDSRSVLFAGYTGDQSQRGGGGRPSPSPSPNAGVGGGYGYSGYGGYSPSMMGSNGYGDAGSPSHGYRSATPNRKGQYSDAVLNELESQNDEQVSGILGKVKVLKDVRPARATLATN